MSVLGVILAGGASRRMGDQDKVLAEIAGQTLLARAIERLSPQVERVVVNGPEALRDHCNCDVVPDTVPGLAGPLAGVLAAMDHGSADAVLTVAVDTPFFPRNLATALAGDTIAIAHEGGQRHPVFALWPTALRDDLAAFLDAGDRKIMMFAEAHGYRRVDFPTADPPSFFNVNTPGDLSEARRLADLHG